jgi:hypothetical protein
VAALGVTVALSQFALAIGLTVLNLVILRGIKLFEKTVLNNYGIQFDSEEKKQPSSDEREQEKIQK